MASYNHVAASGNARQHNGDINNTITNNHNVHNQLGQPNPFTQFLSTQGQSTALHKACAKGDENMVRSILQQSTADLEKQDDEWMTPLQVAVSKNRNRIVQILLDFGANMEARNNMWAKSQRPIFLAIANGNEELVRLLFESGAEIEEGNVMHCGLTPVGVGAREG